MASELPVAKKRIRDLEEELTATELAASMVKGYGVRPKRGARSSKPWPGGVLLCTSPAKLFVSPFADIRPGATGR